MNKRARSIFFGLMLTGAGVAAAIGVAVLRAIEAVDYIGLV